MFPSKLGLNLPVVIVLRFAIDIIVERKYLVSGWDIKIIDVSFVP